MAPSLGSTVPSAIPMLSNFPECYKYTHYDVLSKKTYIIHLIKILHCIYKSEMHSNIDKIFKIKWWMTPSVQNNTLIKLSVLIIDVNYGKINMNSSQ